MKELLAKRAQQLGTAVPTAYGAPDKKPEEDDNDERYQNPDDEVGLFANGVYDQDDDEADRIWQSVDEKREKRRKKRREAQEQNDLHLWGQMQFRMKQHLDETEPWWAYWLWD